MLVGGWDGWSVLGWFMTACDNIVTGIMTITGLSRSAVVW